MSVPAPVTATTFGGPAGLQSTREYVQPIVESSSSSFFDSGASLECLSLKNSSVEEHAS